MTRMIQYDIITLVKPCASSVVRNLITLAGNKVAGPKYTLFIFLFEVSNIQVFLKRNFFFNSHLFPSDLFLILILIIIIFYFLIIFILILIF